MNKGSKRASLEKNAIYKKTMMDIVIEKQDKYNVFGLAILVLVGVTLNAINPFLYGLLIDSIGSGLGHISYIVIGIYVGCNVLSFVLGNIESYLGVILVEKSTQLFKCRMYSHIISMKFKEINSYMPGELVSRLDSDAEECISFYYNSVTKIVVSAVYFIVPMIVIIKTSLTFAILSFAVIPLLCFINMRYGKLMQKVGERQKKYNDRCSSFTFESISNIISIKLFRLEPKTKSQFNSIMNERIELTRDALSLGIKSSIYNEIISMSFWGLTFIIGLKQIDGGLLSVGEVVTLFLYLGKIRDAYTKVLSIISKKLEVDVSLRRINSLMETDEDYVVKSDYKIGQVNGITCKNLYFAYDERKVIQEVDFEVNRNGLYGITGENGCGKTTFLRVLSGLYSADGIIFATSDNEEVLRLCDQTVYTWRSLFLLLDKNVFTVAGTLVDNINIVECKESDTLNPPYYYRYFFSYSKSKMPQYIDNNGKNLSSGQKQILNLLRACRSKASVILLDEITSDMDEETKAVAINIICILAKEKIIIATTHDRNLLEVCTDVYFFENGKLFLKEN